MFVRLPLLALASLRARLVSALRLPAAVLAAVVVLTSGLAWTTEPLPRRLVIGIDGVGFADMQASQQAGAFRAFYPVSRLISTFPSISDIAWSEIFQVAPPPGYQRVYFRLDEQRTIGGGPAPIRPIDFERLMHLGFGNKGWRYLADFGLPDAIPLSHPTAVAITMKWQLLEYVCLYAAQ